MSNLYEEQPIGQSAQVLKQRNAERLSLYNQFGSLAYGTILQIIPNEFYAQEVLKKLFSSPVLDRGNQGSSSTVSCIIKYARLFSLELKTSLGINGEGDFAEYSPKTVFDMSYKHGYSIDVIVSKYPVSKEKVLKDLRAYMMNLRGSN